MDSEAIRVFWGIWIGLGVITGIITSWISLSSDEKKEETLDQMRGALGAYAWAFNPSMLLTMVFIMSVLVYVIFWPVSLPLWIRKRRRRG